jgi:hypothetical protein
MKNKILILCSCLICAVNCFSQHNAEEIGGGLTQFELRLVREGLSAPRTPRINFSSTRTIVASPCFDINSSKDLKQQSITKEDIYLYSKKEKNHDSTLIMTQYFDSLGNIVETDEFNKKTKEVGKITNMDYLDGLIIKKQATFRSPPIITNNSLEKEIETYDYDSAGNIISVKSYIYYDDILSGFVTIHKKEYDSAGRLSRALEQVIKDKDSFNIYQDSFYVYQTYLYDYRDRLTEIRNFDQKGNFNYSHLHKYDSATNMKSVYLSDAHSSDNLLGEFFFDTQKRIIEEKHYEEYDNDYSDQNTQSYSYNLNGLVESQSFEDFFGKKYFYKHYYTSK